MINKIGVVIHDNNNLTQVEKCIENIIHQSYKNVKILLVNDMDCNDKTPHFKEINDATITCIQNNLKDWRSSGIEYFSHTNEIHSVLFIESCTNLESTCLESCMQNMIEWGGDLVWFNTDSSDFSPQTFSYSTTQMITNLTLLERVSMLGYYNFSFDGNALIKFDYIKTLKAKFDIFVGDYHFGLLLFLLASKIAINPKILMQTTHINKNLTPSIHAIIDQINKERNIITRTIKNVILPSLINSQTSKQNLTLDDKIKPFHKSSIQIWLNRIIYAQKVKSHRLKARKTTLAKEQALQNLNADILTFLSYSMQDCIKDSSKDSIPNLIISLTTYPKRIHQLHYTLYSLFTQNIKPSKIILTLSIEEFPNKESDLPQIILDFARIGLEILWCEKNTRSYNKLIYVLEKHKDSIIITADDDIFYQNIWLERLYNAYLKEPHFIHCHRAHRVSFENNGEIKPYLSWKGEIDFSETTPSFLNLFTGVGGVLYPPNSLHNDIFREDLFMKLCPFADDIWFYAMALLNETKINVVENNISTLKITDDSTQIGGLFDINQYKNDEQLQNVLKHYPQLQNKITFNPNEYWESRYKNFYTNNSNGGG